MNSYNRQVVGSPLHGLPSVISLISDSDKAIYRKKVKHLTAWCLFNNLSLNFNKTKINIDFRKTKGLHSPLLIDGSPIETVSSYRSLGIQINRLPLSWSKITSCIVNEGSAKAVLPEEVKEL